MFVAAAEELLLEQYIPPAAEAAIFEALATVPGTEVHENVTDLAGREGVAVGHVLDGSRFDLIFDATTYRYLGTREILTEPYGKTPAGHVNGERARLRIAIVDEAGRLPR